MFQLYILEAFLDRVAQSSGRDAFVLKGGVLLAAFGERRPTRDVDMHGKALSNDASVVLEQIVEIASLELDDGVVFDPSSATAEVTRNADSYAGVRVSIVATLLPARHRMHVDVNVGDPIVPAPLEVRLPRLLGGEISLPGYPLVMVHAEKIVTAVARGTVNSRWRDFMDVVGLANRHPVDGDELIAAIRAVALHRGVVLAPLAEVLAGYADIGQQRWSAWRRKHQVEDRVPDLFAELIEAFVAFADPVVMGRASGRRWDPDSRAWR